MPYFGTFGYEFLKKLLSYSKSEPSICQITKFREKRKMPKFGTKNALFEYLWARILKNYCHI